METLAFDIRAFLARTGTSQSAFAREASVPAVTIWHLLHGTRRYLRSDTYDRIREALARLEAKEAASQGGKEA